MWTFFEVNENDKSTVDCLVYHDKISRGGKTSQTFGTSNLIKHLKNHTEKYDESVAMEKKQESRKKHFFSTAADIVSADHGIDCFQRMLKFCCF